MSYSLIIEIGLNYKLCHRIFLKHVKLPLVFSRVSAIASLGGGRLFAISGVHEIRRQSLSDTLKMSEIETKGDSRPLEKEKEPIRSNTIETNSLQDIDEGGSCPKAAGDFSKDDKLISILNEEDKKGKGKVDDSGKKVKKKRKNEVTENESKSKVKSKKVRFSGQVEPLPSSDTKNKKLKTEEEKLVRGKRFTPEEDQILKDAVQDYITSHELGKEGLNMVLNCSCYPEIRNCWKEIATCIPYRPQVAVYYRAHILFERGGKWTEEETEILKKSYEKHGNNWKRVAEELGKSKIQVKDKWRKIKLTNQKGGRWSQEEYQNLYDMVNVNLKMKVATQERRSMHGMLRDDISWGVISNKLLTRSDVSCCTKWYGQLTSSLVEEGKWSNADDYWLIKALYELDATCVEDVDWDCVLEHRPGDVCRKRWDQMVHHIGHHGSKPFSEQVEILSERYCPDLAETREAWDNLKASDQ
ncbi:hypothetical protein SSX86_003005 [Deinandra increscens subsp. villosa]|uniref:Cyclin-D-binding Myb-like transcription factor 1 n=1 Tax=Deinandra increscens subsp. villosa TaxID=3103831 RepID=A0AAP0HBP5_9ASTR